MKDATEKSAPTGNKRSSGQKGKSKTLIAMLLDAVRQAVDAYRALSAIDARFQPDEVEGLRKLSRFAKRHAQLIMDGAQPDGEALRRTTRLADNVGKVLDTRFEGIMRDSFIIFDKGMASIRATAPELLVRDSVKIIALQDAMRRELDSDEPTYDGTVEAYKAMMAYLPSVSAEAEAAAAAERNRLRKERDKSFAAEVLAELDELDI